MNGDAGGEGEHEGGRHADDARAYDAHTHTHDAHVHDAHVKQPTICLLLETLPSTFTWLDPVRSLGRNSVGVDSGLKTSF